MSCWYREPALMVASRWQVWPHATLEAGFSMVDATRQAVELSSWASLGLTLK